MSSITAIYSQINKPVHKKSKGSSTSNGRVLKTSAIINRDSDSDAHRTSNGVTAANTTAVNGISNGIHSNQYDDNCSEEHFHCFEHYVIPPSERSAKLNGHRK